MRRVIIIFGLLLGALALAIFNMPMSAQNQQYPFPGYPPQFAPSRTSRPAPVSPPRPANKFNRVERRIPGEYIVVLNDDTPEATVAATAGGLAVAHGGNIKFVWTKALKGFSVRMPEAAAIALSNDPRVQYVYENGIGTLFQSTQQGPLPWGLDRIDQIGPVETAFPVGGIVNNGSYTYPNDGAGVHVYVIDTGIFTTHNQFKNPDGTYRASVAWDTVDDDSDPTTPTNSDGNGNDGFD